MSKVSKIQIVSLLNSTAVLGGEVHAPELMLEVDVEGLATLRAYSMPVGAGHFDTDEEIAGQALRWTARGERESHVVVDARAVSELTERLEPLLQEVFEAFWVSGSFKELDTDAGDTVEEISSLLNIAPWSTTEGVVDAQDWLEDRKWEGVNITAHTSDEELKKLEPAVRKLGEDDGAHLYDIGYALNCRRDQLRELA